ncbi:MAG: retropepsin-like domain-containing protein [Treponema sp.]|nr:retropepsin-like domain-containing protein [Candidatus Treponema caballi]
MSKKVPHQAFAIEYNGVVPQLETKVGIVSAFDKTKTMEIKAVWDTGATHSVITPRVFTSLGLFPIDTTMVTGVNSQKEVPVTMVDIILPNRVRVPGWRVTVCDVGGCDMLIGMDIIHNGDFSIANGDGKTTFSFAIPPFENKTNLVDKATRTNEKNKKYFNRPF